MSFLRAKLLSFLIGLMLVLPAQALACLYCPMTRLAQSDSPCHVSSTTSASPDQSTLTHRCCCTMNEMPGEANPISRQKATLQVSPKPLIPNQMPIALPGFCLKDPNLRQNSNLTFAHPTQFTHTLCAIAILKTHFLI